MFVDPCIIVQFLHRKPQQDATVYYFLLFLVLHEAQHVSSDTPPIVRNYTSSHWFCMRASLSDVQLLDVVR
jgi:hypothetical protein